MPTRESPPRPSVPLLTHVAAPIVVLVALMTVPSPASASAPLCRAVNTRTGEIYVGADQLHLAIDEAARDDTLRIRGECVGNYVIARSLRLIGEPTRAYAHPSLDGARQDHVLVTSGAVRIYGLTIKNGGRVSLGGGIFINRGSLLLGGRTIVVGNSAKARGGGVNADFGRLVVSGHSVVRGNRSSNQGGAISTAFAGSVHVTGGAVVKENRAQYQGGGIYGDTTSIIIGGHAVISGNYAGQYGGGIADSDGSTELRWHAAIVRNVARTAGGGWYGFFSELQVCSRFVVIRANVPDDAPDIPITRC